LDLNNERIARLGTFYEEGAGHRIGPGGALDVGMVASSGIKRRGDDSVAISDLQHRVASAQDVVKMRGNEPM
jgi:hypothetical protein